MSSWRTGCCTSSSTTAPTLRWPSIITRSTAPSALKDLTDVVDGFRKNETEMPGVSTQITDVLDRGWHYATLFFGETQIRTGHLLVAALKSQRAAPRFQPDVEAVRHARRRPRRQRRAHGLGAVRRGESAADGRLRARRSRARRRQPSAGEGARGNTALDRFSVDMTAKAKKGKMDPVVGRDEEIRKIIDVLMRRRQNNPILTGEAGVGKTAVVEGFAQRLADGDVPPQLKGVRLCALDIGLMQAGASMKGEFEQRLRSVIDEVQASPTPIILFIDEAHTLIGAGGAQGTGDAANLLKPALARGTLQHDRRHDLGGVSPVFREGPGAHAPLPAGQCRRAVDREVPLHAARHPRADGKASQGAHLRRGGGRRGAASRHATFRPGSCPTRR